MGFYASRGKEIISFQMPLKWKTGHVILTCPRFPGRQKPLCSLWRKEVREEERVHHGKPCALPFTGHSRVRRQEIKGR